MYRVRPRVFFLLCVCCSCGDAPLPNPCLANPELCGGPCAATGGVCPDPLQINELMADNEGAWLDEAKETEDWLELVNAGTAPISTLGYAVSDDPNRFTFLPSATLAPGETVLLWADATQTQGPDHLPFELARRGETLYLWAPDGRLVDRVTFPPLGENVSFARQPHASGAFGLCRFSTPGRDNGALCGPPPPPGMPTEFTFTPFVWPEPWPTTPAPLALDELALNPAGFVEVVNTSDGAVDLADFRVTLAAHGPGLPWPALGDGQALGWPAATAAAGERVTVTVDAGAVSDIAATAEFEGVATLWQVSTGAVIDRVDFMAWPAGAALARLPTSDGGLAFCAVPTPGATNALCAPLSSRPVGDRLRHLYTPGDFAALAAGGVAVGMDAVKLVIDMDAGDVVHLLGNAWDLHYTFVRELIDGLPHLDRCDPIESQVFHTGWVQFSQAQYFAVETRRYLLGTLVRYASNEMRTLEFVTGDQIIAPQMQRAFFAAAAHLDDPPAWSLRPLDARQVSEMRLIEGQAPIVDPNAPFRDMVLQPLTDGVAYGVLTFVPAEQLDLTPLGWQVVVITDQVPNDIPLVGGLITESFQTPLSHVNVLSRNRGTPNMALVDARHDPRLAPHLGTLVRFEVGTGSFTVRPAELSEAEAFWRDRLGTGDPLVPRLDTGVRGVVPLADRSLADLPTIGAKAAGFAELMRVVSSRASCPGPLPVPADAAAVALVHSLEHYAASGAAARLAALEADPSFLADPVVRAIGLAEVQALVMAHPVDVALLTELTDFVAATYGNARVRLRSSSNTEDLSEFNGAGLYTSVSAALDDPERPLAEGLRTVWASLFNPRAYDERQLYRVVGTQVAMGVLLHRAFLSEEANGVAISRNILDPIRGDQYFVNAQGGEASVTNPAPGITTEQFIYNWGRSPRLEYVGQSNLPGSVPVLSPLEADHLTCLLRALHEHFRPLYDPTRENRWFAMDIEFKLEDGTRRLAIKQARPYSFGDADIPADCREF